MRKLIFAINTTLDGCVDHTKQIADEKTHEYFTHLMQDVDLLVFGRKTYQLMVPFWPEVAKTQSTTKAENEFARTFDSIPKVVFSRSLDGVEGRNTRIVRGQLALCMADFGRRQKRRPFFLWAARIPFILVAPSSSWHSRLALSCDLYEWEWLQFGGDRVFAA